MPAQLDLQTGDVMVFGDNAVARGSYTVTPTGAAPMSGSYISYFTKTGGEWKIQGVLTNFSAPPPEGFPMAPETDEPEPPEEGTMKEFLAQYEQLYEAGDWAGLAGLYAEDAVAAFSNSQPFEGRAAIQSRFEQRFGSTKPQLELHDVGTVDLGDGWALDGGWYMLNAATPEGNITQGGTYLTVMRREADGTPRIVWQITNGQVQPAA
jgi:ketosteroid isomerase-like protein